MSKSHTHFKPRKYKDPEQAVKAIEEIYAAQIEYIHQQFDAFSKGQKTDHRVSAYYPYIKIEAEDTRPVDKRLSFGFVPRPGAYMTTVTNPSIFKHYYRIQIEQLMINHRTSVEIGLSDMPIPVHFALGGDYHLEQNLTIAQAQMLPQVFDVPNLDVMDDEIANGTNTLKPGELHPLALFTAPRVDLSLQRLRHYTGTSANHFQNYVIFTNYQFYIEEFVRLCHDIMSPTADPGLKETRREYTAFVEPGDKVILNRNLVGHDELEQAGRVLKRMPQMPAYHLKRADGSGITMINIGVGPSNAKTITDHVAVLRPHAWLMLGHCAGLRNSQRLGDYVLAHGYFRDDHILDNDLPPNIPIPALSEIQLALEAAVAHVTGCEGYELKKIMRTGTVATTDDRNWELRSSTVQNLRLSQSRAIAMDMESGTIAANGFRFRVPYGTLLCVSDRPLHGDLKLPGMADTFYRARVEQHLQIGLLTMALLRAQPMERLHSRKLRSFNEVAFQ